MSTIVTMGVPALTMAPSGTATSTPGNAPVPAGAAGAPVAPDEPEDNRSVREGVPPEVVPPSWTTPATGARRVRASTAASARS